MDENMFTLSKISALLKERGEQQKVLCEYLGLKPQAFTNWKNGSNDSYMKYLPQIADYFGVTVNYLLGKPSQQEQALIPANLLEIIATFSEEEMKELENYIHFIVSKRQ